jgi:hypothetical protein
LFAYGVSSEPSSGFFTSGSPGQWIWIRIKNPDPGRTGQNGSSKKEKNMKFHVEGFLRAWRLLLEPKVLSGGLKNNTFLVHYGRRKYIGNSVKSVETLSSFFCFSQEAAFG